MRPLNIHRVIPSRSSIHPLHKEREKERRGRERSRLSIDVPWISRGNIATRTLFPSYESLIILPWLLAVFKSSIDHEKIRENRGGVFLAIKRRRGGKFLITLITGGGGEEVTRFLKLSIGFPPRIRAKSRAIGSGSITPISRIIRFKGSFSTGERARASRRFQGVVRSLCSGNEPLNQSLKRFNVL